MLSISVIIPTHNRPEFLTQAIVSIDAQSYPVTEVIVVDDGSVPPVDANALKVRFGKVVKVVRNDTPVGIARVRKLGAGLATCDLIVQLDDDDKFAPETLQNAVNVFEAEPELDFIFLNVKGWGPRSDDFDQVQIKALERVVTTAKGEVDSNGIVRFKSNEIFRALLESVPSAFQHPIGRREKWLAINALIDQAWQQKMQNPETNMLSKDQLNECEWALYASFSANVALMRRASYLARCGHPRFYSVVQAKDTHALANLRIKEGLMQMAKQVAGLMPLASLIKSAYSDALFNIAYSQFHQGHISKSRAKLKQAIAVKQRFLYFKFLLRTYLPISGSSSEN